MNSWFLLFKNLCHNKVQEIFHSRWRKNQEMTELSSLISGQSRKLDPYKIFRQFFFLLPIVELITVRINLIFNVIDSLNLQIPSKISIEKSNQESVDFQNILYPNLSNESNNQSPSINTKNLHNCLLSVHNVKKPSNSKKMLLLVAKRCVECKVGNQDLLACIRRFGVWAMSLSTSFS